MFSAHCSRSRPQIAAPPVSRWIVNALFWPGHFLTSPAISIAVEDYQGILIGQDAFLFESFQKKLMAADGLFGDLPLSIPLPPASQAAYNISTIFIRYQIVPRTVEKMFLWVLISNKVCLKMNWGLLVGRMHHYKTNTKRVEKDEKKQKRAVHRNHNPALPSPSLLSSDVAGY